MQKLSTLPNIGLILEKRLIEAGVTDIAQLKNLGSKEAFLKLKLMNPDTCYNTLCALEGAIQGIRWHYLNQETKENLLGFFNTLK